MDGGLQLQQVQTQTADILPGCGQEESRASVWTNAEKGAGVRLGDRTWPRREEGLVAADSPGPECLGAGAVLSSLAAQGNQAPGGKTVTLSLPTALCLLHPVFDKALQGPTGHHSFICSLVHSFIHSTSVYFQTLL